VLKDGELGVQFGDDGEYDGDAGLKLRMVGL